MPGVSQLDLPGLARTLELGVLLRLVTAVVLGAAIGLERELHGKQAGLRTHMLISLGAALLQDVHPEAAHARCPPGAVVVGELVDPIPVLLVRDQLHGHLPDLVVRQALLRLGDQVAVDARAEVVAGLHVKIRRPGFDRRLEDLDHNFG